MEIFKTIKNFESYQISNLGRVRSLPKQTRKKTIILKQNQYKNGYLYVDLVNNKGIKRKLIHRLVCETFIENKEQKEQVNHIDGNKSNNCVANLEWNTRSENQKHAIQLGLRSAKGENNSQSKLKKEDVLNIRQLLKNGICRNLISEKYNISQGTLSNIKNKHTWKHI